MRKKLVSMLLIGAMAIGSLVGCGNTDVPAESQEKQPSQQESGAKESSEADAAVEKEPTVVKILCIEDMPNGKLSSDFFKIPAMQVMAQTLEEDYGIIIEQECVAAESYPEIIRTRMATGVDIPDLICNGMGVDVSEIIQWGRDGLVYDVNELVEQYDTDGSIKAFYDEYVPGIWEMLSTESGALYHFNYIYGASARSSQDMERGVSYDNYNAHVLSLRRDWVEAIGEEWKEVYTPEEVRDLLVKMKEKDANGNGVGDEIIYLDIKGFIPCFANAYGLNNNLIAGFYDSDNKVFSNFEHENFPEYIKFMQSLVEEGVYDTVSLTADRNELISRDIISGAFDYAAWDYELNMADITETAPYYYAPVLVDLDGDMTNGFNITADGTSPAAYNAFFVPKAAPNPEGVTKLMDYIYSDDYAVMNHYGVEGLTYEIDDQGVYVRLTNEEDPNQVQYPGSWGCHFNFGCVWVMPKQVYGPLTAKGKEYKYMGYKEEWNFTFNSDWYQYMDGYIWTNQLLQAATDAEAATVDAISGELTTYCEELLVDLILKRKSLDDLPTYLEEMHELGLQDYIDVLQARRDRVVNPQ